MHILTGPMARLKSLGLYVLAVVFVGAGLLHFLMPEPYLRIMPPYLPAHLLLVYASGAAEIGLGLLLLPKHTRRWGAWGLVALLIAVFPANLYMAQHNEALFQLPAWAVWGRLPVQGVLIWWAWQYTRV
ncbi:MauE/DoxX family redox-associated membrane protein [Hymenobacter sp. BT491]|uniref:DoxX family protein n=1 Tax=Hymenobacter sp. BT491 TaxID=2766779 RepID=UPI00292A3D21|nr:MauE/DoxX family redox-associated membrane protein [Hymenobacter sp. BT491]